MTGSEGAHKATTIPVVNSDAPIPHETLSGPGRLILPVKMCDDGTFRYLKRSGDVSVGALLASPLANLVSGEQAMVEELARVSISVPTEGGETVAQVLAQILQRGLRYIDEVDGFSMDDYDKRFVFSADGGLLHRKQVILYKKCEHLE